MLLMQSSTKAPHRSIVVPAIAQAKAKAAAKAAAAKQWATPSGRRAFAFALHNRGRATCLDAAR